MHVFLIVGETDVEVCVVHVCRWHHDCFEEKHLCLFGIGGCTAPLLTGACFSCKEELTDEPWLFRLAFLAVSEHGTE